MSVLSEIEKLKKDNVELKVLNCVQKNTIISFKKAIENYCEIVEKYNALAKENADIKQKIQDFRKAVLNPKNNSMTLFEKFDELFAGKLK
jgi:ABC-type enterochelin transport system substrate-binding protein